MKVIWFSRFKKIYAACAFFLGTFFLGGVFLAACSGPGGEDTFTPRQADTSQVPHAMLPDNVSPQAYRLDLVIDPDAAGYYGTAEIDVVIKERAQKIWLHGKNMTVTKARAVLDSGEQIDLEFTALSAKQAPSGIAYITAETELPAGKLTLILPFETPYNLALDSAYKVERDGEAYIVTQFEAMAAREAFPSFDEPRFKVPFDLSITAPAQDVVIANTAELSAARQENGWIKHEFARTRPLPTYLLAFAVGPYDIQDHTPLPATNVRSALVPLRALTAKGLGAQSDYALEATADILETLEAYFDVPYKYGKLDLIAAPEYAYGAMENPGAIVYREYFLLLDENAPLSQIRSFKKVHAHELAHQWFGNLVTPFWWEDIWLNEAFATWMSNKAVNQIEPEGKYDQDMLIAALDAMKVDSLKSTRKIREPLLRSENVMQQFDSITYRKGGGVLSMFEAYLGEDVFRSGVRLHMKRFADKVAAADDFFKSLADASGNENIVPAMKSFVDQPGVPLLAAQLICEEDEDGHFQSSLKLTQSRYAPLGSKIKQGVKWQIPVCAKFGFNSAAAPQVCGLMRETDFELTADAPSCASFIMPNSMGAGYYRFALDDKGWAGLIENIDSLDTLEVLSLQDSLEAALKADRVSAENYFKAIRIFADYSDHDVVSRAGDMIGWIYTYLPEARDDLARLTRSMYAARFEKVENDPSWAGQMMAPSLAYRLLRYGQMEALEARYEQMGADYLGLDGSANPSAAPPHLLEAALTQVMRGRGVEALQPLLDLLKNGSTLEKSTAGIALGAVKNTEIAARLRQMAVYDADAMTGRQASYLLESLVGMDEVGQESWLWFKDNFDVFIRTRAPESFKMDTPYMAPGCSRKEAREAESFFTSKSELIPGYERSLAKAREEIELCAAFKNHKETEIIQALAKQ